MEQRPTQRLSLASIILQDNDFIILDEPTSGLDQVSRNLSYKAFIDLKNAGKILLILTHDQDLVSIADDQIRL